MVENRAPQAPRAPAGRSKKGGKLRRKKGKPGRLQGATAARRGFQIIYFALRRCFAWPVFCLLQRRSRNNNAGRGTASCMSINIITTKLNSCIDAVTLPSAWRCTCISFRRVSWHEHAVRGVMHPEMRREGGSRVAKFFFGGYAPRPRLNNGMSCED